jgi:HTH-type transcriptional regulator / antitoxin HigA
MKFHFNMANYIDIEKSLLSPPGDTIQEHIDSIGMTQAELAERMGRPKVKINDLIKGRDPISIGTAFQLEKVLGIPALFWLNRENTYRTNLFRLEQRESYNQAKAWVKSFPIVEMKKWGWLPETKNHYELHDALLTFYGIASHHEWTRIYAHRNISVSFKLCLAKTKSPQAMSAWLRKGELQLNELTLTAFDKSAFKRSLYTIKKQSLSCKTNFKQKLQAICAQSGVAVIFTPALSKAPIKGAARWFHQKPMIQLSNDFKNSDDFWFTFFHEAGHLILHNKKDVFIEAVEGSPVSDNKEAEANAFASLFGF